MSSGYRFKRSDAMIAAEVLIEQLAAYCHQIAIAGSLRRGKASVGDIELVARPVVEERELAPVGAQLSLFGEATGGAKAKTETISHLDQQLNKLIATGVIFHERPYTRQKGVWGEKRKQFWLPLLVNGTRQLITVDLYIVTPPAQWGSIFTIRTGDAEFTGSAGLMKYINTHTPFQQVDGRLIVRATGEDVATPTEHDYFRVLGLPWIEPADRTQAKLWQVARGHRVIAVPTGNSSQRRDTTEIAAKSGESPGGEQTSTPYIVPADDASAPSKARGNLPVSAPVQLKLWPDAAGQVEVQCDHCGWRFDVLPQIKRQQIELEHHILAHPRVKALQTRARTQAFFEQLLPTLLTIGGPVGVQQIADETDYSVGGAHYQLQRLVDSGVLRAVDKVQNGTGTYHQYELAIWQGRAR